MKLYHFPAFLSIASLSAVAAFQSVHHAPRSAHTGAGAWALKMLPDNGDWMQAATVDYDHPNPHQRRYQQQQQQQQVRLERFQRPPHPSDRHHQQRDAQQWMNQEQNDFAHNPYGNQPHGGDRPQQYKRYNREADMMEEELYQGGQGRADPTRRNQGRGGQPQGGYGSHPQQHFNDGPSGRQGGLPVGPRYERHRKQEPIDLDMGGGNPHHGQHATPRYERYRRDAGSNRSPYRDYSTDDFISNTRGSNRMEYGAAASSGGRYNMRGPQGRHGDGGPMQQQQQQQQQWGLTDADFRHGTGSSQYRAGQYGHGNF